MAKGLDIILGDEQVRSVFVNVFGGITACDQVARGIIGALETLGDAASKPLVVRSTVTRSRRGARFSPRLRTRSSTWKKRWTVRPGVQLSSQPRPRRSNDPRTAGEHHDYLRQL